MPKAESVLEQIVNAANHNNEITDFGKEVVDILLDHGLIDQAVYEILIDK